jgi:hypothetical protein
MCKKLTLMILVAAMDIVVCIHTAFTVTAVSLSPMDLIQAVCRLL